MKPRIRRCPSKSNMPKWHCFSEEVGSWGGTYLRQGKGYSLREAYDRWSRYGHHGRN